MVIFYISILYIDFQMKINKDTKIFASFSLKAGNNGCLFFNKKFNQNKLNAIYKSFSVKSIKDAVEAAKTLSFSGFAVSMPFKTEILKNVDEISEEAKEIGAANTVIIINNKLIAYNTDYIAIQETLRNITKDIIIIGNGGFSKAAQYACKNLKRNYVIIDRNNWNVLKDLKNCIVINCTPVENIKFNKSQKITFIDGVPHTKSGKKLAKIQAEHQFNIYKELI